MLICLMGPSCTGKSTLASTLHASKNIAVSAGKDYLRLAKSEGEARRLFFLSAVHCAFCVKNICASIPRICSWMQHRYTIC